MANLAPSPQATFERAPATTAVSTRDDQIRSLFATLGRLEQVIGVLSEAIAWTDEAGRVLWCNPAFSRLSMKPSVAIVGQPVEDVLTLDLQGSALGPGQHPVRRVLNGERVDGSRAVIEAFDMMRGGQRRRLEVYAARLRSHSGLSAMMVVRDNTERHLAETWLEAESQRAELVRAVAAASNEAEEPETALRMGLRLICRFLGWPLGRAILLEPGADRSAGPRGELWHREPPYDFADVISTQTGRAGDGLSGLSALVAGEGKPVWVSDISDHAESPWAKQAADSGLVTALALPVKSLREVTAVLEFFSPVRSEPAPELMPLLEQIVAQLGRVFERQQARLSLLRAKQGLEERVAERTKELTALNASLEREISKRETFQAALRESMERYHSLMQSVRDVIFSISSSGRIESLNSAFDTMTGWHCKEQVLARVLPLIHREDRRAAWRAFQQALAGQSVPVFEIRISLASGGWTYIECSLTLQARAGREPSVAGTARDVTDSRRSKAELMVRDRAISATSEGIVITDPRQEGNPITFVNTGFERLTGYGAGEAIGKNLEDLLHGPATDDDIKRRVEQAIAACQPLTVEMQARRQEGETFWTRLVITPVLDEKQSAPANFVAILSDISPQKAAERMKNDFVSTVSHELRTPLTSLRGFAELMLEREYPAEKQRKFIQIIHRESTRLGNLINDFLDVQRMEAGRQDYRFSKVSLLQVISDSAALFRPTSPIHQFEVVAPEDLPEVRADVDRLRQVTTNLLSNAVKFSPKGGLVALEARVDGAMVELAITDQGIGIPSDAIGKLFGKFYRVDNTETRKIGGTGLGLSIVKQIVDAHGGQIWVTSEPGQGTRIVFTLPVFA